MNCYECIMNKANSTSTRDTCAFLKLYNLAVDLNKIGKLTQEEASQIMDKCFFNVVNIENLI